jgi:hypothetical protein
MNTLWWVVLNVDRASMLVTDMEGRRLRLPPRDAGGQANAATSADGVGITWRAPQAASLQVQDTNRLFHQNR